MGQCAAPWGEPTELYTPNPTGMSQHIVDSFFGAGSGVGRCHNHPQLLVGSGFRRKRSDDAGRCFRSDRNAYVRDPELQSEVKSRYI